MSEENELPEGWVWTTLNIACNKIQDGSHFSPKIQYDVPGEGRYPYITAKNIRESGLDLSSVTYVDYSFHKRIYEHCNPEKGDVLLTKDGVKTGVATINSLDEPFSLLSSVALLKVNKQILNSYYLKHYLNSPVGFNMITGEMTGTAIKRIVLNKILVTQIPLSPLAEQHRIVAAIEQQFTRLDVGVAALQRAKAKLKRYRAAVLKAAVEGKLTEAWRAEHPTTEPASVLLERILMERRAKWEADVRAKGKDPAKVRYVEPAMPDIEGLPELPEGWCWAMLGDVGHWSGGGTPSKAREEFWAGGDIPWVSPKDMKNLRITDTEDHLSSSALEETLLKLCPVGTVLVVVRSGILQRTLPVAVSQVPVTMNQDMKGIYPQDSIDPMYIAYYLISSEHNILSRCSKDGTTVASIESEALKTYPLPLPPYTEQEQIVAEIERRLSVVTKLEATVEANLKRAERLRQSILREAFAGRLVEQDPGDESASVLLERIRGERGDRERKSGVGGSRGRSDRGRVVRVPEPGGLDVVGMGQVELWEGVGG